MDGAGRRRAVALFPLSKMAEAAQAGGPMADELIRHVVTVAAVAPSVYNTQPWRFRTDGYVIDLFADRTRQLHYMDAPGRLLALSCGAALHHLRLAIRGLGRDVEVRLLPDAADHDHLARVIPGPVRFPCADRRGMGAAAGGLGAPLVSGHVRLTTPVAGSRRGSGGGGRGRRM